MRHKGLAGLGVILALVGTSCTTLQGSARAAVLAYSEPMVDNLMAGFAAANYSQATRDFDETMRGGLDSPGFLAARGDIRIRYGDYVARSVDQVVDNDTYVTVYYRAQFTRKVAAMNVSFTSRPPHQIAGWWVRDS